MSLMDLKGGGECSLLLCINIFHEGTFYLDIVRTVYLSIYMVISVPCTSVW